MQISGFLSSRYSKKPFVVVLGHPILHSKSPQIHNAAAKTNHIDVTYHAVDCPIHECNLIPELLSSRNFRGANVTIPLKQEIIRFLDDLNESAREIGAVNTIVPVANPDTGSGVDSGVACKVTGYNTDAYGFMKPLEGRKDIRVATILGSGGASRAITYALSKAGVERMYLASRSPEKKKTMEHASLHCIKWISYEDLDKALQESQLIVNATPVGMYPGVEASPLPDALFRQLKGKICYDIIANPLETRFLRYAKKEGAETIGGLDMFIHQAARAFELWFNKPMPVGLVRKMMLDDIKTS